MKKKCKHLKTRKEGVSDQSMYDTHVYDQITCLNCGKIIKRKLAFVSQTSRQRRDENHDFNPCTS